MRSLITFCLVLFVCSGAHAQIFWNENFETGAATGLEVSSYTSWTMTTGSEGAYPNRWYVSCEEAGHIAGGCGTDCATTFGLGATLHIGADPIAIGDMGASYDAGGLLNTTTDRRAISPAINCTGHSNITLRFYYIENGQGTSDDGSVWYYDGSTWTMLVNTAKTSLCGAQGQWAQYTTVLPTSANNNPNVKIGFQWVNNNDGAGSDPSFAVDSITLSTTGSVPVPTPTFTKSSATVCQDSCITFTNTTTGTIDSFRWKVVGAPLTSNTSPLLLCFPSAIVPAATYTMRLYVYLGGAVDSFSSTFTINPAPHPVIVRAGSTFSVTATYSSYQWYNGTTTIAGATNRNYVTTVKGAYSVVVDSGGCKGIATYSTLAASMVNGAAQNFWVSQTSNNSINLFAASSLDEPLTVTIYDATGRKMYSDTWSAGSTAKQVNTDMFAPGMYLIRLNNNNTSTVLRWLK
jgi:hypothetical protein